MKKSMTRILTALLALGLFASVALANAKQINVSVKGMMCSSCAKKMEGKLKTQDGVEAVSVDLKKGLVKVTLKDGKDLSDDQIKTLLNDHDYTVGQISRL